MRTWRFSDILRKLSALTIRQKGEVSLIPLLAKLCTCGKPDCFDTLLQQWYLKHCKGEKA